MDNSVRQKGGIDVSAGDERDYRHVELANGLCVLLVSDSEAEKSAAAMDVRVGHQSDPDHLLGLAHFLEHMLFMGTKKYPDENSYSQYLSAHGGSSNAYTSGTDTNYYFDVRPPYFEEALDRFAQFFIAPLFTPGATEREMNAVNSENNKNLQSDPWRLDQVVKHTSSRRHPFHKFGTGNLVTLGTAPTEEYDDWSLFCVEVEATEAGLKHVDEIVDAIYQYLHLVQQDQIAPWVFDETQSIALMNFRFRSKETPINYATSLATRMQLYPVQHIVAGSSLLYTYNPVQVESILSQLTPRRMRLTVVAKDFEGKATDVEPWYGTLYAESALPPSLIQRWESPARTEALFCPHPNAFIPHNFDLVTTPTPGKVPVLLRDDAAARLWVKTDTTFLKPKLNICLALHSPLIYQSPTSVVLTDLLVRAIKDQLTEYTYDAELAGMRYSLSFTATALELYGGGYSDKLPVLVQLIVANMVHFNMTDDETFHRLKDKTKRSYDNFERDDPYKHALYFSSCLLEDTKWMVAEKAAAIAHVTRADLMEHAAALFRELFVEAYYHGNVDAATATTLLDDALATIGARPVFPSQRVKTRAVELASPVEYVYAIPELNVESVNSGLYTCFQLGRESMHLRATNEVFAQLLREPCFNQLRTLEQLGYIVFSSSHRAHGIEYFRMIVQSDVASPAYKNIQAVVDALLDKPKAASEECSRFWSEISAETYLFTRRQDLAAVVRTLTIRDILTFFDQFILGPNRAKCSVHLLGHQHVVPALKSELHDVDAVLGPLASIALDLKENATPAIVHIKDIRRFKLGMPLFPERPSGPVQLAK
ncbi:hypothetical protein DYB37_008737 [Aphanomyces astaci]|uniref:Peptidase M16 N-terminal domain-containing protein n=1 Tax=Aphanomyces astaci TaxID=112090 RepID=A0A418FIR8_APHAT|nr:hypothetical protein DYB37_008737 [Aphanomyces astaci]